MLDFRANVLKFEDQFHFCIKNIFKLIVVDIRLQQISYCYRWIHVLVKRIRNKIKMSQKLNLETPSLSNYVLLSKVNIKYLYDMYRSGYPLIVFKLSTLY